MTGCTHGMPSPASCITCMEEIGLGTPGDPMGAVIEFGFIAKFNGQCPVCVDPIEPGEYIYKLSDDTYIHQGCWKDKS